jgi:hypothetical protein
VARFGRYIGFGPERLAQVESSVQARAAPAVLAGRLIPGLRIVTVIAAGVVGVRPAVFFPALGAGAFAYLVAYTLIGYFAGPPVLSLFARVAVPVTGLLALAGLIGVVLLMRMFRRAERIGPFVRGSVATVIAGGVLAACAGVLTSSAVVGFAGFVERVAGGAAAFTAERTTSELQLLFGWPLFFATALLLVGAYAWFRVDRLPLLPLATTVLLIDPLTDTARVGLPAANAIALATVATIRWITFAIAFELLPLRASAVRADRPPAPTVIR